MANWCVGPADTEARRLAVGAIDRRLLLAAAPAIAFLLSASRNMLPLAADREKAIGKGSVQVCCSCEAKVAKVKEMTI